MSTGIEVAGLSAWYGDLIAIEDVTLSMAANSVTAIIGPSGCGKSTLIRCLNRLHEVVPSSRVEGKVLINDTNIYEQGTDPVSVRRMVGMVFQRANPFPTMTIYQNVAAGYRLNGRVAKKELDEVVERSLTHAGLLDEVKDRLDTRATSLSGGQQQRLCIARAIAIRPEVLLMDEPTAALDPAATLRIEDLIGELKKTFTVVIVTHNMQQAARVADNTAFLLSERAGHAGKLIEYADTHKIFTRPDDPRTEDYITGRFG
ncbi:MAG TPA: phosphate ABC transporter ATP-binding protein PstB [Actinomycetota bacterium]|nr:phosphate ABC transporter ATP-binding protein PstB [Actinomycetota bacterium]